MIKRFILLLSSVLFALSFVLLMEGATRLFKPEINFQDTERSLLRERAFGDTYGWKPSSTGISFGKQVYIDEFGFRRMSSPAGDRDSWLILGDSVTFGVGVETDDTYAQLLQNNYPDVHLWNTSVIGYDVRNYRDVLYGLTSEKQSVPNLKRVLLFFCLNDVDLGQSMGKYLEARPEHEGFSETLLSFLRRHSKLYMLLKNAVSDRSKFYFEHDYELYEDDNAGFAESMKIVEEMSDYLSRRNIDFTVVILPYEYQLRTRAGQNLLPQKRLDAYFADKGITYIDAYDYFAHTSGDEKENFLYADFCHLSKKGHRLVFNLLKEKLKSSDK